MDGALQSQRDDRRNGTSNSQENRENGKTAGRDGIVVEKLACVKEEKKEERFRHDIADDPRVDEKKGSKVSKKFGGGRNTESFDPKSTLVRPDMRVVIGPNRPVLGRAIKHDDVIVVPEFFCQEDDWSIYHDLISEMREAQAAHEPKSEWMSWHEGASITDSPVMLQS